MSDEDQERDLQEMLALVREIAGKKPWTEDSPSSVRMQVVVSGVEARLFNVWCRKRGFVKNNGNANFSSALAFLIRREIDIEVRDDEREEQAEEPS